MNPSAGPPGIDPLVFEKLVQAVRARERSDLLLSSSMIAAVAATACAALSWRRAALAFGFLCSLGLCFVSRGRGPLLGPVGCALALAGFLWPRRSGAKRPP
jgi:hypothetical protein